MHLGHGVVTPECALLGFAIAAGGCVAVLRFEPKSNASVARTASLGALVFALQMINLPILASSSLHFVGGVLLAELLGATTGIAVMSIVLALQAVLLGDGAVSMLGWNAIHMAIVPALLAVALQRTSLAREWRIAAVSSGSIMLAAASIALIVSFGGRAAISSQFASEMLASHAIVALFEAAATVLLVLGWKALNERTAIVATAFVAICLAAVATTISSVLPDAYEGAIHNATSGILPLETAAWLPQMLGSETIAAVAATILAALLAAIIVVAKRFDRTKIST